MLLKRCVFKCLLKVAVEAMSRSDCGKLFHALWLATENAFKPMHHSHQFRYLGSLMSENGYCEKVTYNWLIEWVGFNVPPDTL